MSIKMVVTDLDGTLLKDDKTISDFTAEVLDGIRSKGIKYVVATARPIRAVKYFLPFLDYDSALYHNGAVIMHEGKIVDGFGIKNPVGVIAPIMKCWSGRRVSVEAEDRLYANFNAEEFWPGVTYDRTEDFDEIKDLTADKILVEARNLDESAEIQKLLPDHLYAELSENTAAMIMDRQATKINGIRRLAQIYGIDLSEVVAFGDDHNDIKMLEECGTGVAMANSFEGVKYHADEICGSNEDDGVARWLKKKLM